MKNFLQHNGWRNLKALSAFLLFMILPLITEAHVKWFTTGRYTDKPNSIQDMLTPSFYWLMALTFVVIALGVFIDNKLMKVSWYNQVNNWLESNKDKSILVLRIATAITLLLSWQDDSMLVPNLKIRAEWIGWYQFLLAFLLIFRRTVPLAGAGLIGLFAIGNIYFSRFHMLDYVMYAGVGYYLAVSNTTNWRIRRSGLQLLYLTVGFSLCWVALEKFIYPDWAIYLLEKYPELSMGLQPEFFLMATAFVEFGLGYLLIVCLLQRPLAVIITLVFFTTTTIFGKLEIIGHTLIHGALIVFLFEGPGPLYNFLTRLHPNVWVRMAFTSVNFVLLFIFLLLPYNFMAKVKYEHRMEKPGQHHHMPINLPDGIPIPSVQLILHKDSIGGYNVELKTENFRFAPESAGRENVMGEGHAHLYLNDDKIARIYSPWYHLPDLRKGEYELRVSLHANNHDQYVYKGRPIEDVTTVTVKK